MAVCGPHAFLVLDAFRRGGVRSPERRVTVVGSHLVLLELDPVLSKAQQVLLTVQPSLRRSLFGF